MNDESVSPLSSVPLTQKNAYCLFYVREKGDLLKGVIGVEGGEGKKRRRESGEEGEKVERPKQKRKEESLGSTYTPGEGPKPPMIATASKVSSPKLDSTPAAATNSFNPFVTPSSASTAVEPSPPAAANTPTNQSSGLEATAMKRKLEKLQAKRNKLYESKQLAQPHSHSNGHGHGGRGGGRGGKKIVHQMQARNKPRVIN